MRKLKAPDVFAALRVVSVVEKKEDISKIIRQIVEQAEDKVEAEKKAAKADGVEYTPGKRESDFAVEVGVNAVFTFLELATTRRAEARIYEFLAGPFEMPPEAVQDMGAGEFMRSVAEMARENDLGSFFKSVLDLKRNM